MHLLLHFLGKSMYTCITNNKNRSMYIATLTKNRESNKALLL